MKKLSSVVNNVLGTTRSTVFVCILLAREWERLAGSELAGLTNFFQAKFVGKHELLVTVDILSSAVVIANGKKTTIEREISLLTGVSVIRIRFRHITKMPHKDQQHTAVAASPKSEIEVDFSNKSLKEALAFLKSEIQNAA